MQQCMSPERFARIQQVLSQRQHDLTLLMEEVHKPHNVSAIIRTADAVGIHQVHAVWAGNPELRKGTALGSQIWVRNKHHDTTADAVSHLKSQGMQVLVTHLDNTAVDFRQVDYTKPTAIIMGQEKDGATEEAVELADQSIVVPMIGMVQSLNVSVAAATVLYEAQRQRSDAGMYGKGKIPEIEKQEILFEGGFPVLYQECLRRNLPIPHIDDSGCIDAPEVWWQALQYSQ
ncbi:tRNA (guanosine(18)-2'-O)-methyltransferase [Agaribacter marinus]|uniref:tRNA (guanosine(18)-2'-O)-methyltransferase n=2 Tax=Agaribacter marinus TaxID=1431249 RepID=A0AA37T071_9ALTE|nr:tRNA (guanosine(18)-2'-O)-methyltransferase [Agaribacter marinus]